MRNLSRAMLFLVGALVLVTQLGAQSTSNHFVHEHIDGKYDIFRATHNETHIILRPDRIEIFKESNPSTGVQERSTYFLFGKTNEVVPQGRNLLESSKQLISDLYGNETARALQAEYLDVDTYSSAVYHNLFDGVDLEVSFDANGQLFFQTMSTGQDVFPLELKVLDANIQKSTDGFVSNGVEIYSTTSSLAIDDGTISLGNRHKSQSSYSFILEIN